MGRRILLLITDLEIGGTPTVVRELAIRLGDAAHIEVACLSGWGPVADQLEAAGVTVRALGARRPTDLHVIGKLIRLIRENRFDTVFSFLIHANTAAAVASRFCRDVRFIQSIQTTQPNPKWHWCLQRIVQHAAEQVVVPSPSAARAAHDWADVPVAKVIVIPNAIDASPSPGTPACAELRRSGEGRGEGSSSTARNASTSEQNPHPPLSASTELSTGRRTGRGNGGVNVGFLGRLDPIKRVTDLVRAISFLEDRFVLHIFGEGRDRSNIEREIDQQDLRHRVTLQGSIAKPQAAMEEIDLLVLPSEAEGFGLVLIEAMAAGVPVVATDVPGIRDVVQNERTGLLVPVARPDEIARAIERLASSPSLRDHLIDAGRREVQNRFDWSVVLPQYRALLKLGAP